MTPILSVRNVCKSYHTNQYTVKAVDHVSLAVGEKEMVAIVGPSGSGKSTLIGILGLILRPDAGNVLLRGEDPFQLRTTDTSALRNRMFGYIMQDFALLEDETVYRNIMLPLLYNKDIPKREHRQRIHEAAERLGIGDKLKRKVTRLSGGERQRVAIARAIVCDQPIILADEPTGSLDAANKENVMDILTGLCRESGKTAVIVTHDMAVAERCDRIIKMRNGGMDTPELLTSGDA